jgi:type VI secretion system protein VasG
MSDQAGGAGTAEWIARVRGDAAAEIAAAGDTDALEEARVKHLEILARRRKNNVVLIGEAGVGKTAIAEALALRIARGEVPRALAGVRRASQPRRRTSPCRVPRS